MNATIKIFNKTSQLGITIFSGEGGLNILSKKEGFAQPFVEYIKEYQIYSSHPITFQNQGGHSSSVIPPKPVLDLIGEWESISISVIARPDLSRRGNLESWGTFFFCIPAFMHDEK